jgi:ABC-type Zn uptake system ZnuABC Zn-binding protein ZnuA
MKWSVLAQLICLLLIAGGVHAQASPLRGVATTTIVADVAQNVAGSLFTVDALVPPDADVHVFEPQIEDAARVAQAGLLLVVGAGYETFTQDLLTTVGGNALEVVVSNGVEILSFAEAGHSDEDHAHAEPIGVLGVDDLACGAGEQHTDEESEHEHGICDPHVWMNPRNVIHWVNNIADAFSAADAANAAVYRANADAYIAQLEALDADIIDIVAAVPEARRMLVTNHAFMSYFADAYGFEVIGTVLPAASSDVEPSPQQLTALIAEVQAAGVRAVFAEVSGSSRLAQVVAEEAGVAVVTMLYSESLSGPDGPAATYLAFMRYNAQTIADALIGG